jgi:hypothetical protein
MKLLPTFLGAIGCCAVLLAGCGSGNKLGTIPIRGVITYNGKPLTKGIVNYLPAAGGGGRAASGPIAPDGTFILTTHTQHDGVIKGQYQIVIYSYDENPEEPKTREEREAMGGKGAGKMKSLIPEKYTKAATSGLTDTVDENHSGFKQIYLSDGASSSLSTSSSK